MRQSAAIVVLAITMSFSMVRAEAGSHDLSEMPSDRTDEAEAAGLHAAIVDLERRIEQLQLAASIGGRVAQRRSDEIRGLVQDVLADADTRDNLLESDMTAGWTNGFFIRSADGNFLVKLGGYLQARFVYNRQDEPASDTNRSGFEMRRIRLTFSGHVVDPSWQYTIQGGFTRDGGEIELTDGSIRKKLDDHTSLDFGQMKVPFLREELVSGKLQLAADRSLVNAQFTLERSQGVQAIYAADRWRLAGMLHNGGEQTNTAWNVEDTEWALAGRFDWLLRGTWKTFDDFASPRGADGGVLLGVAANWQVDEYGTGAQLPAPDFNNDEVRQIDLTADASIEFGGGSIFVAGVYRDLNPDSGDSLHQWAFVAQTGVFLAHDWELFARYECGDLDISGIDDLSVATIGVNRFFNSHQLKWTTDFGYGLNPVNSPWNSSSLGWRADSPGADGQTVLRSQIQLVF